MFTNLADFPKEKDDFRQKLLDIHNRPLPDNDKERLKEEAKEAFKMQIRQYLPLALEVIKELFNVQYSLLKVGKDYDANFRVVETSIRKTKPELLADIENFKTQAALKSLTGEQLQKFNLAMDVLMTYTDDAADTIDEDRIHGLENAKVVASSIIEAPSHDNPANAPAATTPQTNFNPYADQPIVVDEGFNHAEEGKKMIDDPFASLYGEETKAQDIPTEENRKTFIRDYIPDDDGPISPIVGGIDYGDSVNMGMQQPMMPGMNPNGMDPSMAIFNNPMGMQQPMMPMQGNMNYGQPVNPQMGMNQTMVGGMQQQGMQQPMANGVQPMYQGVQNQPVDNSQTGTPLNNGYPVNGVAEANPAVPLEGTNVGTPTPIELENQQAETLNLERSRTDKRFIISKLLTGFIRIPFLVALAVGVAVLVMFVLQKAELDLKLEEALGEYYQWAMGALVVITCFITASSILGPVSRKTKYVGKYMIASLSIFSGLFYTFILLESTLTEKFKDVMTDNLITTISIFCYMIGAFCMLGSFFSSESDGRVKMNIFEKIGIFWNLYTLFLPTVSFVCEYFKVTEVSEKINLFYDYPAGVIVAISFALTILIIVMNVVEEIKARRNV